MQPSKYPINNKKQIGANFWIFALVYIPTFLFLGCTAIAAIFFGIPPSFFARDPVVTLGEHPFTGMQSHLGVLVLFGTSAICLFCCAVLRFARINKVMSSFLLWSGAIAGFFALDDLFLFHEYFFPRYLGLKDEIVVGIYGILFAIYIIKFRKTILKFEPLLMCLALLFLGASVVVDEFIDGWDSMWRIFFEDGFKLLGIVSWSGYLIRTCWQTIVNSITSQKSIKEDIQLDLASETIESTI